MTDQFAALEFARPAFRGQSFSGPPNSTPSVKKANLAVPHQEHRQGAHFPYVNR